MTGDMSPLQWRKSSRSSSEGGNCVELADVGRGVAVRDSKNPGQAHLTFSRVGFSRLVRDLKR